MDPWFGLPRLPVRIGRRQLLRGALGAAGALAAARLGLGGLAHAQTALARDASRRFVFCYVPGGWDQLLFLDPRDPAMVTAATADRYSTDIHYDQFGVDGFAPDVVAAGGLTFGPATEKPGDPPRFKLSTHHD